MLGMQYCGRLAALLFFSMQRNTKKGFTLIELLVVIAIIGILSSVVLASLNSAREKSRDAKRVSDVKQIQLALELYFDAKGEYPDALSKLAPAYIPQVPKDPLANAAYPFNAYTATTINAGNDCDEAAETCTFYHLGANLEGSNHSVLNSDSNIAGDVVDGDNADSCDTVTTDTTRFCYDVTP